MCPLLSYFNHSCCPSIEIPYSLGIGHELQIIVNKTDKDNNNKTITTTIPEGEELFISYISTSSFEEEKEEEGEEKKEMTKEERRKYLEDGYGFVCHCVLCGK